MQTEKSFQKQLGVPQGFKKVARKAPGKGGQRFYRNVGLGYKTPREAIEGEPRSLLTRWLSWFRSHRS